jgi:small-conductance mechanosensitive channel/CRP-like cAMP-binding protein
MAGFLLVATGVSFAVPGERNHVRDALKVFAVSVAVLLSAAGLRWLGVPESNVFCLAISNIGLLLGGIAMVKLAGIVVFAVVLRPLRLELPPIAQDLVMALGYMVVAIMTLSYAGVNLQGLIATSAVLTAVIGFSLQDSLGNIMGGMVLQIERTIHVGDWIRIDDMEARVKQIRWRQTSVETRDWDTVVIPNSVLMKAKVTMLGRRVGAPVQRRRWVYFRVGLDHSPTRVMHIVETVLRLETHGHIAAEPKPHCLLTDFKEGDAVYAARYWLNDLSQPDPTDSLVRTRIYAALRREGIPLATPSQSIRVTEVDETHDEHRRVEDLDRKRAALNSLNLFQTLTPEERAALAPALVTTHFMRGEAITRQGAEAHWLYIIAEGDANVEVTRDHKTQHVAELHAGDLFGEMGLMTGEPRTATVNAATDVTCYRLGKEAFVEIIRERPAVAEQISAVLAGRRGELDAIRDQLDADANNERVHTMQNHLLRSIRQFFNLS